MFEVKKANNHSHRRKNGSIGYGRGIRINGKKINKYFSRKTDANDWYIKMKREKELLEAGIKTQLVPMKFGDYIEEWLEVRKAKNPISTWKTEQERLNGFIVPYFKERPLHQISTGEWENFLDNLVTKLERSSATRNRYRTLLHKLYQDALRKNFVGGNPITHIPIWKENHFTLSYFETKEDCEKYLVHALREHVAAYVFGAISLNCGPRMGETLALRRQDVDLEKRQIHIGRTVERATGNVVNRTKGRKDRWVPISDDLYEVLKGYMAIAFHKKPSDLVICYEDGRPFSENTLRKIHIRICKKADLKPIRIHDLRHTFASHYMMNGGSLYDFQKILGHSNSKMTERYAHLAHQHLASKANVVSFSASKLNTETRPRLRLVHG